MKNKISSLFIGIGIAIGALAIFGFSSPSKTSVPNAPNNYGGEWQMLAAPGGAVYYYSTTEKNAYYLSSRTDRYSNVTTWYWEVIKNF